MHRKGSVAVAHIEERDPLLRFVVTVPRRPPVRGASLLPDRIPGLVVFHQQTLLAAVEVAVGPKIEDLEFMASTGVGCEEAALRVGLGGKSPVKSLQKTLERSSRLDVWDRLRANDLIRAGEAVTPVQRVA